MLTQKARVYRRDVAILLSKYEGTFDADARLNVVVELQAPTRRKYDLDNRAKALLDSLEHAKIFPDDEQVDSLTLVRGEFVKGGNAKVWVVEC
jgi:crossover junction endodeoxyribonuclease RusA